MTRDRDALDLEPVYDGPVRLEGRYEIDPVPGGKRFQGTWLVLDDGTRYVLSYRPEPERFGWADRRICVLGRPYTPGADVQHVGAVHLAVDEITLAPGETACEPPPGDLPAPPLVEDLEALAGRAGRWARVAGALEAVRDDPDGYLGIAQLRLADGGLLTARNVPLAEWSRHQGRAVVVTSRVERTAEGAGFELVGWYAICPAAQGWGGGPRE